MKFGFMMQMVDVTIQEIKNEQKFIVLLETSKSQNSSSIFLVFFLVSVSHEQKEFKHKSFTRNLICE